MPSSPISFSQHSIKHISQGLEIAGLPALLLYLQEDWGKAGILPMIGPVDHAKILTKTLRKNVGISQKIKAPSSSCAEYLLFFLPQLLLSGWKKKNP